MRSLPILLIALAACGDGDSAVTPEGAPERTPESQDDPRLTRRIVGGRVDLGPLEVQPGAR